MEIKDFKDGMNLTGVNALIADKKIATTKTGKQYADVTLRDRSGNIKCKIWNYSPILDATVKAGNAIKCSLVVSTYNGDLQGVLEDVVPSDLNPMFFSKSTRFDVNEMWKDLLVYIDMIKNPLITYILEKKFLPHKEAFCCAPAAKGVHNAWFGGLIEHTWGMLELAKEVVCHYQKNYQVHINWDKVVFGILMHDLGKIFEYDYSTPAFNLTGEGLLVNHIVSGAADIYEASNRWRSENQSAHMPDFLMQRAELMHLVVAHHGQVDWGSPSVPATLEAVIIHQVDMVDSKFMHALELVEGKEGPISGFSEPSWTQKTSFLQKY